MRTQAPFRPDAPATERIYEPSLETAREPSAREGSHAIDAQLHALEQRVTDSIAPQVHRSDLSRPDLSGLRLSHYELGKRIGTGGMGQVFQARHMHLGKWFAVKVISQEADQFPEARMRFLHEIHAVGKLNHPNIVSAVDAGCSEGIPFLVTEWLEGSDLNHWMQFRCAPPLEAACEIIRQTALGLAHAHDHGFTHRDIKPSNLFLDYQGTVKILDFGLVQQNGESNRLTTPGLMLGTVDYISPEQINQADSTHALCDIYSLGCSWIHLLSGAPPYPDTTHPSIVRKLKGHLMEKPHWLLTPPASIPKELVVLIGSMIAKSAGDRPSSMQSVADQLARYADRKRLLQWLADVGDVTSPKTHRGHTANRLRQWSAIAVLGAIPLLTAATLTLSNPADDTANASRTVDPSSPATTNDAPEDPSVSDDDAPTTESARRRNGRAKQVTIPNRLKVNYLRYMYGKAKSVSQDSEEN